MRTEESTTGSGRARPGGVGAVLVWGSGGAGIQAALDLAESGFRTVLVEAGAAIGGRAARSDDTLSGGDCAMCLLSPKLAECARNRNIEILTLADVLEVSGEPGRFRVRIRRNPRYVDAEKCDGCGNCAAVCPVTLPAAPGEEALKAIWRPWPQAIPNVFSISRATDAAPCRAACPAGVNVPGFLSLFGAGRLEAAHALLLDRCPFPGTSGRICRRPCEKACRRGGGDGAVTVGDLERSVADAVASAERAPSPAAPLPAGEGAAGTRARVAVIGGGPAGLVAARDLALAGYRVTLFEAQPLLGGMLRYGIPPFRLPREVLDREIGALLPPGLEVRPCTRIDKPAGLLAARGGAFGAVFLACGAWGGCRMGIPGEGAEGVWQAVDYLRASNSGSPAAVGPGVLVIGASDLALDAARSALRAPGVRTVTLACLHGRGEVPVDAGRLALAAGEGVKVEYGLGPTRVNTLEGRVVSVSFRACTSVFDEHGRYDPLYDDAATRTLGADTVILASGRGVEAAGYALERRPGGRLLADPVTGATPVQGIFAGGDAVLGPASLPEAIAQGRRAAESMDAWLRRNAPIREVDAVGLAGAGPRHPVPMAPGPAPAGPRAGSREAAEARRCLHCGLCSECGLCIAACSAGAIDLAQAPSELEIEVGGVIVAPEETEAPAWKELAARIGLDPDIPGLPAEPVRTRLPGVYAAGGRGREIAAAVTRGSAAAACAMEQLASVRGTLARPRSYPWERDVTDEEARIGVFVCRCGHQVARAVDVAEVCRSVSALEGVRCVEALEYSCSDSGLRRIKRRIGEHRLNRVVVASCSSRTYEALFQEVLRESGLNRYLLATANIREECAWVHGGDGGATRKAVDLVAMAAARARHLRPLPPVGLPVTASALVLGGGRSGMTAALSLAGQGFGVHLVERSGALGGGARRPGPGEGAAGDRVSGLVDRVTAHPGITLHLDSELAAIAGQAGDFTCRLTVSGWGRVTLAAGAVIVATGPGGENGALAAKLRVALGEDGGFRPAHPVLRPVDLVNEGQFFCTAAHPSPVQERVLRALAAAARAAPSRWKPPRGIGRPVGSGSPRFFVAGGTCVQLCPYGAPVIGEGRKAAVQGVKCAGCGSCVACCPRRAITLRREESGTVTAMLDQLMAAGGGY